MVQVKSNNITFNPFCVVLAGNSNKDDENLATDETKYLELNPISTFSLLRLSSSASIPLNFLNLWVLS